MFLGNGISVAFQLFDSYEFLFAPNSMEYTSICRFAGKCFKN